MPNHVIQIDKKILPQLQQHYTDYLQAKKPPYSVFAAKKNGLTITAYQSGKVMFQGTGAEAEIARLNLKAASVTPKNKKSTPATTLLPEDFANWNVLGSDEVSTGSYFGSAIYAATYVSREIMPQLLALGIKDSKMLTNKKIVELAKPLAKLVPHYIYEITPEKYNQIQPRFNANYMKVVAHHYILTELLKTLSETPDAILIDGFASEKNFYGYLDAEQKKMPLKTFLVTKGEQYHLSVAAASILAKARSLGSDARAEKELGMKLHINAGPEAVRDAAKIINRDHGKLDLLAKYAKIHFSTTQKAIQLAKTLA